MTSSETDTSVLERDAGLVLVVDDDEQLRRLYKLYLEPAGYEVIEAATSKDALVILEEASGGVDAVVLDVHLGAESGLDFLKTALKEHPHLAIIVSTVSRTVEHAIFALKNGAFDYLVKPVVREDLLLSVRNAVQRGQMTRELSARRVLDPGALPADADFVFASPAMRAVVGVVDQVVDSSVPVMILGETGTGKEVIARRLHKRSRRRNAPFITVNCASIPKELTESELFGHEKGAFTGAVTRKAGRFEEAANGTILLDEIGELDPMVQAKLLRVLQENEITPVGGKTIPMQARVVVATNRDLSEDIRTGRFRADLFYRLNVITLRLPPLRERREEIPLLAAHLLDKFVRTDGLPRRVLGEEALEALRAHPWYGNVRELENTLKRTALLCSKSTIGAVDLALAAPETLGSSADVTPTRGAATTFAVIPGGAAAAQGTAPTGAPSGPAPSAPGAAMIAFGGAHGATLAAAPSAFGGASTLGGLGALGPAGAEPVRKLEEYEAELMRRALAETRGNVAAAARRLGIGRSTFYRWAQRYNVPL
ncbi:sigma-54 dependent transcriptional regulator [Myxococcota bacterium]|nr:sigma-54 dependent transcriptional regulator [Myxococcota bacterium]